MKCLERLVLNIFSPEGKKYYLWVILLIIFLSVVLVFSNKPEVAAVLIALIAVISSNFQANKIVQREESRLSYEQIKKYLEVMHGIALRAKNARNACDYPKPNEWQWIHQSCKRIPSLATNLMDFSKTALKIDLDLSSVQWREFERTIESKKYWGPTGWHNRKDLNKDLIRNGAAIEPSTIHYIYEFFNKQALFKHRWNEENTNRPWLEYEKEYQELKQEIKEED
ncbi:MAG: hypothetical protein Tsb0018_00580 [Opitutales bacterium]